LNLSSLDPSWYLDLSYVKKSKLVEITLFLATL